MPFIDEAVVVCSQYEDFLRVTMPINLNHVKKMVVVTSDKEYDHPVRELCKYYGVLCISTGALHHRGAPFAKAKGINRGLDMCKLDGWIAHMDADIVLPDQTSLMLERIHLDPACIYGADRINCPNAIEFRKYLEARQPQYRYTCLVEVPPHFSFMARWTHPSDGYVPIGYFQLWHGDSARHQFDKRYPENANNAIRNDVQHALQWDSQHRRLIPDFMVIHLDSCKAPIGANWEGRQTPKFDLKATEVPKADGVKCFYDPQHPRFSREKKGGPADKAGKF